MNELMDWSRWTENACTDWNGAAMQDAEEPRVTPTCGELRAMDAEISRLRETQRVLVDALRKIVAIDDKMFGGDWDEIEEARAIARGTLASVEKPESVHLASAGGTEATARDAARYRWMRANAVVMADYAFSVDEEVEAVVDAAIAAMSTEPNP